MRLLIATQSSQLLGGIETYLADVIPHLMHAVTETAVLVESDSSVHRKSIFPAGDVLRTFSLQTADRSRVIHDLHAWKPDLIYAHGMRSVRIEELLLDVAPCLFFAHNYHGTCISGLKRFSLPVAKPCSRVFGSACLANYFPRRCGGLNPRTAWRLFREQQRRLQVIKQSHAVITHSDHMLREYSRHGVASNRLHKVTFYAPQSLATGRNSSNDCSLPVIEALPERSLWNSRRHQLTFVGRLDANKGVHLLLEAAPIVARALNRHIHVTIIGDGPALMDLQRRARISLSENTNVTFEFCGWLDRRSINGRFAETNLIVVPSVWPEPFGLVGPEAGHHGIPAAAFAVGGITTWLVEGVNGHLATADPPTSQSLARAITECLSDEGSYMRLRDGATNIARRFNRVQHLRELLAIFNKVLVERECLDDKPG